MEALMPILVVWGILCVVLAAYVAYRFSTDRTKGTRRHHLWPLVSHPTDPSVPPKGAWLVWVGYISILAAFSAMFVGLAAEVGLLSAPFLGHFFGIALLFGLALIGLAKAMAK